MLYAYGATVIEIVRRKEFCKPFPSLIENSCQDVTVTFMKLDSSSSVLRVSLRLWPKFREFIHKLKLFDKTNQFVLRANEKKRRQVYRGEVHGLLPFETRGMDDPVPMIDFSPTGSSDSVYSFERADVDGKHYTIPLWPNTSKNHKIFSLIY